ncbi:hypothetical protein KN825_15325, partial [Weizmannia coagulans]|nr:hypothetical protein [Heyndrickxia coagulans]
MKPWVIRIKLLLLDVNVNKNYSKNRNSNRRQNANLSISFKESTGQVDLGSDVHNQDNLESFFSNYENDIEEDNADAGLYSESIYKILKQNEFEDYIPSDITDFLKRYALFQLRWPDPLSATENEKVINIIKAYCFLIRLKSRRDIGISSIRRKEIRTNVLAAGKKFPLRDLPRKGIFFIDPIRVSVKNDGQFIMYKTIGISLVDKSKYQTNQRYREERYVDNKNFYKFSPRCQKMIGNKDKNHYDLFVPENILSPRHRRKFRILICFNLGSRSGVARNPVFCNGNGCKTFLDENKHLDRDKNHLIKLKKLKFFLWPNFRLEDLACMNRYWFDTNNGSCFSMLRIHMYPRLKIR